eukprot:6191403-Pleurochrysis_carterae.AAC.1
MYKIRGSRAKEVCQESLLRTSIDQQLIARPRQLRLECEPPLRESGERGTRSSWEPLLALLPVTCMIMSNFFDETLRCHVSYPSSVAQNGLRSHLNSSRSGGFSASIFSLFSHSISLRRSFVPILKKIGKSIPCKF